jgi:hypothetical protein
LILSTIAVRLIIIIIILYLQQQQKSLVYNTRGLSAYVHIYSEFAQKNLKIYEREKKLRTARTQHVEKKETLMVENLVQSVAASTAPGPEAASNATPHSGMAPS